MDRDACVEHAHAALARRWVRVIATEPGDAVVFCTRDRLCPIAGLYGRQPVMHGVQEVRAERYAVGIPFCDYAG